MAIPLPKEVSCTLTANHQVVIKGPKGKLTQWVDPAILVKVSEEGICLTQQGSEAKALHGLYRVLLHNMVVGVVKPYKRSMELVGIGYKVSQKKNTLELNVGKSHLIYFLLPPEVTATVQSGQGRNPLIDLESSDKQLLGQVCAKLRSLRKPEPYKGKGIRFRGEEVRRKVGKTAGK